MSITELSTIVPAVIAVGGVFYGMFRFISKVDRNTEATERLTAVFAKFADRTDDPLRDHEHRITVLETKAGS